jgi:hypothetical protein
MTNATPTPEPTEEPESEEIIFTRALFTTTDND